MKSRYKKLLCNLITMMCGIHMLSGCGMQKEMPERIAETKTMETAEAEEVPQLAQSLLILVENPQEENVADLLQQTVAGAMVQIHVGDVVGSGVLWDVVGDKLVIATAAHVFTMGNGVVQVTFADGWTVLVSGYEVTETDLAFFFVDMQEIPKDHLTQYYLVNTDAESAGKLQNGAGVILMGSYFGVAADVYEGVVTESWIYVEDFAQYMIVVRAFAEPGMSGGGLFDYEGHFLGILCGGNDEGEVVVIPLSIMKALYGGFSENF